MTDELNGRLLACQILLTGLIARVANEQQDPVRFLSEFRDEVHAVVSGIRIAGLDETQALRHHAAAAIDELFALMKAPSRHPD